MPFHLTLIFLARYFFWKSNFLFLFWSYIISGGSVKLTQVDSVLSPQFFMTLIFFLISLFSIKLFALELCYFFTFIYVLLFWEWIGQANPCHLAFSFTVFFNLTWAFFVRSFFGDLFFLSQTHVVYSGLVKLTRVESIFFPLIFLWIFFCNFIILHLIICI